MLDFLTKSPKPEDIVFTSTTRQKNQIVTFKKLEPYFDSAVYSRGLMNYVFGVSVHLYLQTNICNIFVDTIS